MIVWHNDHGANPRAQVDAKCLQYYPNVLLRQRTNHVLYVADPLHTKDPTKL
jgi:hypothetical protein